MTDDARARLTIDEVCDVVAEAIAARHGTTEVIAPDTQMLITGLLDSLTLVKIVAGLEARLGAKLGEDLMVARNFRTPTTLHTALEAALAERVG